jgi:hypothetical protein
VLGRRILRIVPCVPVAFAIGCIAAPQAARTAEVPPVSTIIREDAQLFPRRPPPSPERVAALNDAVAHFTDPHDACLELGEFGDATSVPFLIEALAIQGSLAPGVPESTGDTRVHCLDALRIITNQNAGPNAEDWRRWYETNRDKTQQQWILDGFRQHQFSVDQNDDAFVTALIVASNPKDQPRYLQTNALRMLSTVESEMVVRLAGSLSGSPDAAIRSATVAALERVTNPGRLSILRMLAADPNVEVAENALRALNVALRVALPRSGAETVWEIQMGGAGVHFLHVLNDTTVVLGIMSSVHGPSVAGFDLVSHTIRWTYPTGDNVQSNAARIGDRLYFVSDDRVVHCISIDGRPQWAKRLTSKPDLGTGGPAITAAGDRLLVADDKSIYAVTLAGEVRRYSMGDSVSRDLVQGRQHSFGAVSSGSLVVIDRTDPPKRIPAQLKAWHLSAFDDALCVVGGASPSILQCLDQETLHVRWRAMLPKEDGGYYELQQDASAVYVLAQGRALAFDVQSGARLWATNEFRSFTFFRPTARFVLTANDRFQAEWRDLQSGEVVGNWPESMSAALDAVLIEDNAVLLRVTRQHGDVLRLVRMSNGVGPRPMPH